MGFGKDGKGVIIREDDVESLGALAQFSVVKMDGITLREDFRMLKSEIFAHVDVLTAGEGQGLLLGIANDDLSAAEIAACIVTDGPTDNSDRIKVETANRNVKLLSSAILQDVAGTSRHFFGENGSPMITSKHRWTYSNPEGWAFFIFNDGLTLTTGSAVRLVATHFGMWVK